MHVIVEPLPYFLALLQKNVVLYSIIATGSFANIDLAQIDHRTHSDQAIDLLNFSLGKDEVFPSVNIMLVESGTTVTFHTPDAKYFDYPELYFGILSKEQTSETYTVNGMETQTRKKYLGKFVVFDTSLPLASVYVRRSSLYGCVVVVSFYKHDLLKPKAG